MTDYDYYAKEILFYFDVEKHNRIMNDDGTPEEKEQFDNLVYALEHYIMPDIIRNIKVDLKF